MLSSPSRETAENLLELFDAGRLGEVPFEAGLVRALHIFREGVAAERDEMDGCNRSRSTDGASLPHRLDPWKREHALG